MIDKGKDPARITRGRPSKQDAQLLRKRIQATALEEFRRRGFAGTSIDGIARAASASRTTIYALYADKQTLFTEIVKATITGNDIAGVVAFDDREPAVVLREAMQVLNRIYYRQPNLEIIRLCIAEADRFPDLFEQVLSILARTLTGLVGYFERMRSTGSMIVEDSARAALLFNMLALGSLKPFFIHQDRLSHEDTCGHLDLALQLFLRGCFRDDTNAAAANEPAIAR